MLHRQWLLAYLFYFLQFSTVKGSCTYATCTWDLRLYCLSLMVLVLDIQVLLTKWQGSRKKFYFFFCNPASSTQIWFKAFGLVSQGQAHNIPVLPKSLSTYILTLFLDLHKHFTYICQTPIIIKSLMHFIFILKTFVTWERFCFSRDKIECFIPLLTYYKGH